MPRSKTKRITLKKHGPSKSWDYSYVDGLNGLPKLSSAANYSAGYRHGRQQFRVTGGKESAVARKTLGYATASQRQRQERGWLYA